MMFPHSPGAPAGEVVNCRCYYNSYYVGETRPDGSIIQPPTAVQSVAAPEARPQGEFNPSVTFDSEADLQASYLASLSEDEADMVRLYQGNLADPINAALRGRRKPLSLHTNYVFDLDSAIKNAPPLSNDAVVYRGLKARLNLKAGDIFTDAGFVSTSFDENVAKKFKGLSGTVVEMRIPKGSRALVMRSADDRNLRYNQEQELLFGRDRQFRVVDATPTKVTVELIPESIDEIAVSVVDEFNPTATYLGQAPPWEQAYSYLSTDAADALVQYQDEGYSSINKALRSGKPTREVQKQIDLIDTVIQFAPRLTEDALLYRGISVKPDWKVGDIVTDSGFMSTSFSEKVVDDVFALGGTKIEIRAGKGTKGFLMRTDFEIVMGQTEEEFLLGRGRSLRILEVREDRVIAELVDE
jgi:hypothetical protein